MSDEPTVAAIFKDDAVYEGGHPRFLKKSRGTLMIWSNRLEFRARKGSFSVSIGDVVGCDLRPMQFGFVRSVVGATDRAVQVSTPMAFVTCNIDGDPYELRFHMVAWTIPGEAENAVKFKDALYTLQPFFAKNPLHGTGSGAADAEATANELRQLAALKTEGVITEQEFTDKKRMLLDRL